MIFLIYHDMWWQEPKVHLAKAKSLDELYMHGEYGCVCGTRASGKNRRWRVVEGDRPPDGLRLCQKCESILRRLGYIGEDKWVGN